MEMIKSTENGAYNAIEQYLPQRVRSALAVLSDSTLDTITEIRLRAAGVTTVTIGADTLFVCDTGIAHGANRCVCCTADEIDTFIYKLCGGSVYAYETTMRLGYISVGGIRVGLAGHLAAGENGMYTLSRIDSVNIRLPRAIPGCAAAVSERLIKDGFPNGGLLIASAPGVGKTTYLRDLAATLSRPVPQKNGSPDKTHRVVVIDEREELYRAAWFKGCAVDVLCGMPKSRALEWAVRSLSPEIVVLDEIGSEADASAILAAHLGGVKLLASVHETSLGGIFMKPTLAKLCECGVFGAVYLLERRGKSVGGTWQTTDSDA